jgi:hypothetical protein
MTAKLSNQLEVLVNFCSTTLTRVNGGLIHSFNALFNQGIRVGSHRTLLLEFLRLEYLIVKGIEMF